MTTSSPDAMVMDPRSGKAKYIRYAGAVKARVEARRQREAAETEAWRAEGKRLLEQLARDLDLPADQFRTGGSDETALRGLLRYHDGRPERARIAAALRARWLAGLEIYVLCWAVGAPKRRAILRAIDRVKAAS